MKTKTVTGALVFLLLTLNLGVAHAQQKHVKMTFSGTLAVSPLNLQPDTNTDEQTLAGDGTLGRFTLRELHADPTAPQPSSLCSGPTHLYFPNVAGGGVFRFEDRSLLTVEVTTAESAICIDLAAGVAHLTTNYQITGGTGRFKRAAGTLTLTATLTPVLSDASGAVVLATDTGKVEGTVFGVDSDDEERDNR